LTDVIENTKLVARAPQNGFRRRRARLSMEFGGHSFSGYKAAKFLLVQFPQPSQVRHLFFEVVVCSVEPIAPICATMNSEWSPDRVSVLAWANFIMLREDFYSFRQSTSFDSHSQFQCQVVDVHSALARKSGRFHEDPEVPTALAHFQGSIHSVLLEGVLEFQQVFHRTRVIGVD